MAITCSSPELPRTKKFIITARRVDIVQQYPKKSVSWLRTHNALVATIEKHLQHRMPEALSACMNDRYLLPIRADRYDTEKNLRKFAIELALTIAERKKTVRSLHFIAPIVCSNALLICEFFKKEFRCYVETAYRQSPSGSVIFDFTGTRLIQEQN